jgi:hypothetical protein
MVDGSLAPSRAARHPDGYVASRACQPGVPDAAWTLSRRSAEMRDVGPVLRTATAWPDWERSFLARRMETSTDDNSKVANDRVA